MVHPAETAMMKKLMKLSDLVEGIMENAHSGLISYPSPNRHPVTGSTLRVNGDKRRVAILNQSEYEQIMDVLLREHDEQLLMINRVRGDDRKGVIFHTHNSSFFMRREKVYNNKELVVETFETPKGALNPLPVKKNEDYGRITRLVVAPTEGVVVTY